MAYTTINKSTDYFNNKLYTGNGSTNAITGVGHQPDLVWLKERSSTGAGLLFDAVRTATKFVRSSDNAAEVTAADTLTAFNSDGFTLGADASNYAANQNSQTYASWNWKAGAGQGSSNTDGSINTTYTSVNTTAGFSICKWTGTGSAGTVGHGLGAVPKMIIVKNLDSAEAWPVYHNGLATDAETDHIYLNTTDAKGDSASHWNDTAPTSTVFSLGTSSESNKSGSPMIAYCFAEKTGYSKFGSYTGNGNADGSFIYTGFKPAFLIIKKSSASGNNWFIYDNKRPGYNEIDQKLYANGADAEEDSTYNNLDFLSNGFKLRTTDGDSNTSGGTYIFMAFGQSIVGSNNVPCTAG